MKRKETWEDKLKDHLGDDAGRFPVPEGQFASIKEEILAKKNRIPAHQSKTYRIRPLWLLALPAAAALAFLLMNKAGVKTDEQVSPVSLNEAAEGFYEQVSTPDPVLEFDQEEAAAIRESGSFENLQSEVVMEDYLYEELEAQEEKNDPFAGLETVDIEEYLVDHQTILYEL